jgi:hypothetical protein
MLPLALLNCRHHRNAGKFRKCLGWGELCLQYLGLPKCPTRTHTSLIILIILKIDRGTGQFHYARRQSVISDPPSRRSPTEKRH